LTKQLIKSIFCCRYLSILLFFGSRSYGQQSVLLEKFKYYYYENCGYDNESYRSYLFRLSATGSSHDFEEISYGIDALRNMYKVTLDTMYLNDGISLINRVISLAEKTHEIARNNFPLKSKELGWIDNNSGTYMQGQESSLYEGKLFKSVLPLIYEIQKCPNLVNQSQYKEFVDRTSIFIRDNVWKKWFNRSYLVPEPCGKYIFDGRTHMASHWATIALYLSKMFGGKEDGGYSAALSKYNASLKANMKRHPLNRKAVIWNSTWDKGWFVSTGCRKLQEATEVQDMSHGNEVVSYIIKSYELGFFWTKKDIKRLVLLTTEILWLPSASSFCFLIDCGQRKKTAYFIAEGFAKLGKFSSKLTSQLSRFIQHENNLNYSRQGCQLLAVLMFNEKCRQNL